MKGVEWHVRFNVASTVKDGFRVGEITVSADYDEGNEPTEDDFRDRVRMIYAVADEFCHETNRNRRQTEALTR